MTRKRRPLTRDDIWAIVSWAFVGHGAFILVGTTTFASIVLLVANSLQIQEYVACQIGKYLTKSTGVQVSFGSAMPNWRDGKLSFKDVKVYCGPPAPGQSENYTQYDLTIESFDVAISLARMLEGRGLAKTASLCGVRGTLDRSHLQASPGWWYKAQPGDFDLEGLSIRDMLINVISPGDFRPFSVSVLSAEMPRLRKRFLMYDMLSVNAAVGMFDRCLFSVHTPQIEIQEDGKKRRTGYSKMRHLKIDGLNVDHFNTGVSSGPFSWLQRGTVDIDAFVQLPDSHREPSEDGIGAAIDNIREHIILGILKESSSSEKSLLSELKIGPLVSPTIDRLRKRIPSLRPLF